MADRTCQEASPGTGTFAPTPNFHYASMRHAEQSARHIASLLPLRRPLGEVAAVEFDELRAAQASFYLLAAAHRAAGHRLERGERFRSRVERVVRPVVRGILRVRRAVTA